MLTPSLWVPRPSPVTFSPSRFCRGGSPKYYITETYALHHHETPTGLRFLLLTSPDFGGADISRDLRDLYADAYVPYVVKNPLSVRGEVIRVPAFLGRLDSYVRNLSCF